MRVELSASIPPTVPISGPSRQMRGLSAQPNGRAHTRRFSRAAAGIQTVGSSRATQSGR
jgi:hypothetical protein